MLRVFRQASQSDRLSRLPALTKLNSRYPEAAALIELACFGGVEVADAAGILGMSRATAYRRWRFAQAWLRNELASNG
jgi:DNA-directed RNA polymerase specialized sigma24 family protein